MRVKSSVAASIRCMTLANAGLCGLKVALAATKGNGCFCHVYLQHAMWRLSIFC